MVLGSHTEVGECSLFSPLFTHFHIPYFNCYGPSPDAATVDWPIENEGAIAVYIVRELLETLRSDELRFEKWQEALKKTRAFQRRRPWSWHTF